jgi:hypothetical protein
LIKAGFELGEHHLDILKMWGVAEVDVQLVGESSPADEGKPTPSGISAESLALAEEQSKKRFALCDLSDPVTAALYRLSVDHCAREIDRRRP